MKERSRTSNPPIIRAGLRGEPVVKLSGAPTYKGSQDVTEIIVSIVPVNSGFHV